MDKSWRFLVFAILLLFATGAALSQDGKRRRSASSGRAGISQFEACGRGCKNIPLAILDSVQRLTVDEHSREELKPVHLEIASVREQKLASTCKSGTVSQSSYPPSEKIKLYSVPGLQTYGAFAAKVPVRSELRRSEQETSTYALEIGNFSLERGVGSPKERSNSNCLQWKSKSCTVCGLDHVTSVTVSNKTKTPLLLCSEMKPGTAKLVMETHAESVIPGAWEVEFGLGYRTSARSECPHQFIASNNPTRDPSYEIGPISIESEIPSDGKIQALVCIGLSSARVGREGKETGASLKISRLVVISQ